MQKDHCRGRVVMAAAVHSSDGLLNQSARNAARRVRVATASVGLHHFKHGVLNLVVAQDIGDAV